MFQDWWQNNLLSYFAKYSEWKVIQLASSMRDIADILDIAVEIWELRLMQQIRKKWGLPPPFKLFLQCRPHQLLQLIKWRLSQNAFLLFSTWTTIERDNHTTLWHLKKVRTFHFFTRQNLDKCRTRTPQRHQKSATFSPRRHKSH